MSILEFIQKDNVTMLWEVISDEENFKFLTRDIQAKVYQLFLNNIQGFFDNEKTKTTSLVDINKKYILLILNYIKRNYNIQPNKITIHQEPLKETITYEDIQNDRRAKFERDFNRCQEEFEDFMTVKAPPAPEFADKETDRPIKEMDKILKVMQAQRNYEIEQINRNQNTSTQIDNWLKPQETSLKTEKFTPVEQSQNYSRFKFLNTIDQDVTETIKDKKNVSFSNKQEIQTFNVEDEEDDNIFSKLKKVSNKENENIKMELDEISIDNSEDRIAKLEGEVKTINSKMDKILELLSKK
jgi:hypothetical protein